MIAIPVLAGHFAAGMALGILYFGCVWWTASRFTKGAGIAVTFTLMAGRFVLLGGFLVLASLEGAMPLLVMALGVLLGRFAIMRRVKGLPS